MPLQQLQIVVKPKQNVIVAPNIQEKITSLNLQFTERAENEMDFTRLFNFEYKKAKELKLLFKCLPNVPVKLDLAAKLESLEILTF